MSITHELLVKFCDQSREGASPWRDIIKQRICMHFVNWGVYPSSLPVTEFEMKMIIDEPHQEIDTRSPLKFMGVELVVV